MSVTVTGANSAAGSSVTIPSHAVGNLIVVYAYRNNSTTNPTVPTAGGTVPAWVQVFSGNALGQSYRTYYFVATATNHTTGTWTNATHIAVAVLTGHDPTTPIGQSTANFGTSSTQATVATITPFKADGTAAFLGFAGHQTVTAWSAAPAGYTQRTAENTGVCLDTQDATTTSSPAYNQLCTTSGSGNFLTFTLEVCSPGPRVTGSASAAATSVAIPAHAIGDLLVVWAYRDGSTTTPTAPAAAGTVPAWVDIDNNVGGNSNSARSAYFIATATTTTTGTWTNATGIAVAVIKGHAPATPIGAHAEQNGASSTNAVAAALTLNNTSGTSHVLEFYGHQTVTAWSTAPTGYRRLTTVNTECAVNHKDAPTSAGSSTQNATTSASGGYYGQQIEILGPYQPDRLLLTLTGSAPVVTTGLLPAGVSLTLTGSAPTVTVGLLPAAAALTLTGSAPMLASTIPPGGATLTLAGSAPVVTVGLSPAAATLTLTGSAPVITSSRLPAAAALTLAGSAPTLTTTVFPGAATLSLTGSPPTVTAPALTTPDGAALALTGSPPTVTAPALTTPDGATLTFTGAAPSLTTSVFPGAGTLTLIGAPPSLGTTLRPDGVSLTLAGSIPAILNQPTALTPAAATLTLAGSAPVILNFLITPTPAQRIVTPTAQAVTTVGLDNRTTTAQADSRTTTVAADNRTTTAQADGRTTTVAG